MRIRSVIGVGTILIVILLLCGAGYRAWQVLPYPVGTGESKKSPNGRFEASATDYYDESFWGRSRHWFEFELLGGTKRQRVVTDPIPGPYFGSRSTHSVIFWADDSSSVRFVFPTVEIAMKPD